MSYDEVFQRRRLPRATYVFTDLDRLHFWDLEWAARLYRHLQAQGLRVLNDPARFRSRYQLLRQLHRTGLNPFDVWYINEQPPEAAYPVFLRTDSAHRGPMSELLHTPAELDSAVRAVLAQGVPLRELLIVQYAAEPTTDTLYRKLSVHRIGDTLVAGLCAHQDNWVAKLGQSGIATAELYDDEYRIARDNPYADFARRVFDAADIDYGRLDFALVNGQPVAYEVNTNPNIRALRTHAYPIRLETSALVMGNLSAGLQRIDTPERGSVPALPERRSLKRRLWEIYLTRRISRQAKMP